MKRMLFVLSLMLACTGCLHVSTLITLKPDGSGTMNQEIGMNPQALSMLAAFAGNGRGGQPGPKLDDVFTEQKAREQAEKMGVRFVSGTPIDTPTLKGYRAQYAFDDIKALKVRMQDAQMARGDGSAGRDPFDFDFTKGASSSTLTIRIPQDMERAPMAQLSRGDNPAVSDEQAKQMLAMMRPMFAGMYIDVAVAVDGQIVRTNAPFVTGNRVTLVQVDMDKIINDETAWAKLQKATTPADMRSIVGMKVPTEPTLTIEFRK